MKLEKDANGKNIEPEWEQMQVVHCPDNDCNGMLLQSKYYHEEKCSKCGKIWILVTTYIECEEELEK